MIWHGDSNWEQTSKRIPLHPSSEVAYERQNNVSYRDLHYTMAGGMSCGLYQCCKLAATTAATSTAAATTPTTTAGSSSTPNPTTAVATTAIATSKT